MLATVTAVQPPGRFGALEMRRRARARLRGEAARRRRLDQRRLLRALAARSADYIEGDETVWEREPMERLAARRPARALPHDGFWQPMDTLRDKSYLEELWAVGRARRGRTGSEPGVLARPPRAAHRAHRLQGKLARAVAARASAPRSTGFSLAPPTEPVACSSWRGVGESTSIASTATSATSAALERAVARAPAGDRDPPGRAVAGAALLRRPGRDLRDQRDGHRERARGGAPRGRAVARR